MLKSERKQIIMDKLSVHGFVSLEDLVPLLESSESTVRRDLDELELEGKLCRVHGGAELKAHLQEELSNSQKSIKNVQKKSSVISKALNLVHSQEVIFIDAGTTNALLVEAFEGNEDITVVTNSIHHASRLVEKGIKTIIVGGFVKHSTDASVGNLAVEQIRQLNFDKAFLGMNGVDENFLTTPDMDEAVVKRLIIENAKQAYVLVDSSKIGQASFVKVAPVEKVVIITNNHSDGVLEKIKEKTKVVEV